MSYIMYALWWFCIADHTKTTAFFSDGDVVVSKNVDSASVFLKLASALVIRGWFSRLDVRWLYQYIFYTHGRLYGQPISFLRKYHEATPVLQSQSVLLQWWFFPLMTRQLTWRLRMVRGNFYAFRTHPRIRWSMLGCHGWWTMRGIM